MKIQYASDLHLELSDNSRLFSHDIPPEGVNTPNYRSISDPTVFYHDNKWYLYPSYGMAWVICVQLLYRERRCIYILRSGVMGAGLRRACRACARYPT